MLGGEAKFLAARIELSGKVRVPGQALTERRARSIAAPQPRVLSSG